MHTSPGPISRADGFNVTQLAGVLGRYSQDRGVQARMDRVMQAPDVLEHRRGSEEPPQSHALRRRLSWSQQEELVRRYEAGEGCSNLARVFGISENGVLGQLRRSGVVLRTPGKLSEEDVASMRMLRAQGMTHKTIAEQFGVTRSVVTRRLRVH